MVHMPRQVEYALMVLVEMQAGPPGELFAVRRLTGKLEIPFDVTSKAMQAMARAGVLRSVQGKYGGYQIVRNLRGLSLLALMEIVAGPPALTTCLQHGQHCQHHPRCAIRKAMHRLDARVSNLFQAVSVHELIA